jgi:hypothetical protein
VATVVVTGMCRECFRIRIRIKGQIKGEENSVEVYEEAD